MSNSTNSITPDKSNSQSRRSTNKRTRPSFLNYAFSMRGSFVYKNMDEKRYFVADKTDKRTGVIILLNVVLLVGLFVINLSFNGHFVDLFFDSVCLYILFIYVLLYVDFMVMRYQPIEKSKLTNQEIRYVEKKINARLSLLSFPQ